MTAGGRFSMCLATCETSFVRKFRSCAVQRCALTVLPPYCVLHDRCLRGLSEAHSKFGCCGLQAAEYAPIRQDYEDFYTRRMYYRLHVRNPMLQCAGYMMLNSGCLYLFGALCCTRRTNLVNSPQTGLLQSANQQRTRCTRGRAPAPAAAGSKVRHTQRFRMPA